MPNVKKPDLKSLKSDVASFYEGKTVLITGGTGFLGKNLIEKLLYSCRGIHKIYMLVRDKNDKQAHERLARIINAPAFDRLRGHRNEDLKKIKVITGDVTRKNFGLPDDILKCLEEEVSVVFHLAACVAFKLPLKDTMRININGTEEVIAMCRRMKKIEAFIHVSTAFTNADQYEIKEEVYMMPVSLEEARKFAEMNSHDEKAIIKYIGKKPNTYTFSKAFAEEIVAAQSEDLPSAIIRPSIVISSLNEPTPGWIDTLNGASGIFIGMPAGILRVLIGRGHKVNDLVPVDIVTNLTIVAATKCERSKKIKVYNCCTGTSNPITCKQVTTTTGDVALKHSINELPYPYPMFTACEIWYTILTFFLQIIPAFLIDLWCIFNGKPAQQLKLQQKLKKVVYAVKFFLLNDWKFADGNVRNLLNDMSPEDRKTFNFDVKTINWEYCLEQNVLGTRKLLKSALSK